MLSKAPFSTMGSGTIQQAAGRHRQAITATDFNKAVMVGGSSNRVQIGSIRAKVLQLHSLASKMDQSTSL